jgi:hypothetical protein
LLEVVRLQAKVIQGQGLKWWSRGKDIKEIGNKSGITRMKVQVFDGARYGVLEKLLEG